jgi:hypothetical protein
MGVIICTAHLPLFGVLHGPAYSACTQGISYIHHLVTTSRARFREPSRYVVLPGHQFSIVNQQILLLAFEKLVKFCYSRLAYSFATRYLLGLQIRHHEYLDRLQYCEKAGSSPKLKYDRYILPAIASN